MQERTLGYRRILNRRRIIVRVLCLKRLLPGMLIFAAKMSIRIATIKIEWTCFNLYH